MSPSFSTLRRYAEATGTRLTVAEAGDLSDDEKEPLPGIGPLTSALDVFADFFHVDPDLVRASAERPADADGGAIGYERAVHLLRDLRALAEEDGSAKEFSERVRSLRDRHERKRRFIERLAGLKVS